MVYRNFPVCCQKFEWCTRAVARDLNLTILYIEGFL